MIDYLTNSDPKAKLIFADGDEVEGYSFGSPQSMSGEVVFNTGMVG
jgi:carbamoylphosphate synthase small subunit